MMAMWYPGTNVAQISWHLSYSWGKISENNLNQETEPTGDGTRARCVRGNDVSLDHSGAVVELWENLVFVGNDAAGLEKFNDVFDHFCTPMCVARDA